MNLLTRLLNRMALVFIRFSGEGRYTVWICYLCRRKSGFTVLEQCENADLESNRARLKNQPVLMLVSGYGVITKVYDTTSEIVQKVTVDPENFRWSLCKQGENQQTISFVRSGQMSELDAVLEKAEIAASSVVYISAKEPNQTIIERYAQEFYIDSLTLRHLIRPTASASALCGLVVRKLRLPVLLTVLLVLLGNNWLATHYRRDYQQVHAQLIALRQEQGKAHAVSEQKETLLRNFGQTIAYRYAWLCDRIASQVPTGVSLVNLTIQPLRKALEENQTPVLAENVIIIQGESTLTECISVFMINLQKMEFGRKSKLCSVERHKDGTRWVFKIEIGL